MANKRREGSVFHLQRSFSQRAPKKINPAMWTNTVAVKRKGGPQHLLNEKTKKHVILILELKRLTSLLYRSPQPHFVIRRTRADI